MTCCVVAVACAGEISPPGADPAGNGNGGGLDGDYDSDTNSPPKSPSPLQRINAFEYRNAIRDLFPEAALPAVELPPDEIVAGFAGQLTALLTDEALAAYLEAAETVAGAVSDRGDLLFPGCNLADQGQEACVEQMVRHVVPRAYRRSLTATEERELTELHRTLKTDGATDRAALEGVIVRFLVAPSFLYKIELGTPTPELDPKVYRLNSYELAARLSFFLWRSIPDEELFLAASRDELTNPGVLAAQALRMLEDERAADAIWNFHEQWLELTRLASASKSESLFPEFNDALVESMRRETQSFVRHVVYEDAGTFETLLTARYSFLDDSLAQLYGIDAHQGPDAPSDLGPQSPRAGLLGHASFLTAHAKEEDTSVVHRGLMIRRNLICESFGPPPAGVETLEVADRVSHPQCGACHTRMDPIGFGLEDYDAIGRYQGDGGGGAAVSLGTLAGLTTGDVEFSGPAELGDALVRAPETWDCYARQWYRYAMGRPDDGADQVAIAEVAERVGQDGGIRDLIIAVIESLPFQTRGSGDVPKCEVE